MAIKDSGKNVMLDALGAVCTHLSLHTGFPATSGNEVTGGTPAYARKAITFAAANAGSKALNGTMPVFDVPPGTTVMAVGFNTALTLGTLHADDDITNETFAGQGTYTVSSGSISLT